jgi:hypothetical protein
MIMSTDTVQGPVPFSISDIFAYIIPGATLMSAITLFEHRLHGLGNADMHMPVWRTFSDFVSAVTSSDDSVLSLSFVTALVVSAYVVGHVTSSVSSFFIDRILVFKGHGYPYRYLLNLHTLRRDRPGSSHSLFYRGTFFWLNFLLVSVFWFSISDSWVAFKILTLVTGWLLVFSSIKFAQHNVPSRRGTLIRRFWTRVHKGLRICQTKFRDLRRRSKPAMLKEMFRVLARHSKLKTVYRLHAMPYNALATSFTKFTNSQDMLEEEIRLAYKRIFSQVFRMSPNALSSSNYWLVLSDVISSSNEFRTLLNNWLRLYEFSRNLGTAFYLAFVYCLVSVWWQREWIRHVYPFDDVLVLAPLGLLLVSFVMFGRYYYLYVCYYSKFTFRAFVFLHKDLLDQLPNVYETGQKNKSTEQYRRS